MSHRLFYKGFMIIEYEEGVFKAYRNKGYADSGTSSYELSPSPGTPATSYDMFIHMIDDAGDSGEFDESEFEQLHPSKEEYEIPSPEDNISTLGLTDRTEASLRRASINSISKLSRMGNPQLLALRNFGQLSLQEVRSKIPEPTRDNTYVIKWSGSISWNGDSAEDAIEDFKTNPSFGLFMEELSHFEESKW